jgi:RimJ/RimL family protein N-acetyltransferase
LSDPAGDGRLVDSHSPATETLRLVALQPDTLRALYAGRADWAATQPELGSVTWPDEDRRMLRYRIEALEADPASAAFLVHAAIDQEGRLVARIGCHAAPDQNGEVEIGYAVTDEARGHGVGGWTVDTFLGWLAGRGVRSVIASVRPENEPSLAILRRRGFVEYGSQIDDEDGLELLFRRALRDQPTGPTKR